MIITCKNCSYTDRRQEELLKESAVITFICPRCNKVDNIQIKYTYRRLDSVSSNKVQYNQT